MVTARFTETMAYLILLVVLITSATWWHLSKGDELRAAVVTLLEERLNYELIQLYWAWQQQGRPDVVQYQTGNSASIASINVDEKGKPRLDLSLKNCAELFFAIVPQKELKKYLGRSKQEHDIVSIDKPQEKCVYDLLGHSIAFSAKHSQFSVVR